MCILDNIFSFFKTPFVVVALNPWAKNIISVISLVYQHLISTKPKLNRYTTLVENPNNQESPDNQGSTEQ
jgi:hypothetical protein